MNGGFTFSGLEESIRFLLILLGCGFCCGVFALDLWFAGVAGHIARGQNRNAVRWVVIGLFAGPFAVVFLLLRGRRSPPVRGDAPGASSGEGKRELGAGDRE